MDENKLFKFIKNQEWDEFIKNADSKLDYNVQDENLNYMVQYIILYNNIKALNKILSYNIIVDWLDTEGKSILYPAIKYGYIEVIKILLEYDENNIGIFLLDSKDSYSQLPIHYALKFKNLSIYKLLIKKSKATIYDKNNNSLLHLATQTKNIEYLIPLFEKNININSINNLSETALHIATTYDLNNIIEKLIEKNIDVNIQELSYGFTPLFICILNNNDEGAKMLLEKTDINLQDHNGNTALHIAIMENNYEIINECLKEELNYNIVNIDGDTYLHLILNKIKTESIDINRYNMGKFLSKSILNIQNNEGKTPWHYIIELNIFTQYESILVNTSNNLFINDRNNITPYSLIIDENKSKLLEIISQSYYNLLKTSEWNTEWENDCKKMSEKKCMEKIKENIIKNNKSVPVKKTSFCVNVDEPQFVSFTTFTGINFDVLTTYLELSKKYSNLFTTINENFSDNIEVEKYYNKLGIIKDLDNEYLNFEIFWIFQQLIFPTHIENTIATFIKSDKELLIIPLAIENDIGAHANVIIVDKRFKIIERFEPNGKKEPINYHYNHKLLDNLLEMYFKKHFTYEYLPPVITQQSLGFQSLEMNENEKMKKIGDPGGFCVSWCLWYVEQRAKYNYHPTKLSLKLIINIRSKNISFKKLIRLYSNNILKTRNIILDQLEIDINDIRNNNINEKQKSDIKQLIKLELLSI